MKPAAAIVAVLAVPFAVAVFGGEPAMARSSLRSADQECADTANAEVAISACTGLYENRGLGRRNRAIALGNRGAAYKLLGRYDEAIADFGRALELDPGNSQYYCQRGDARMRTGANNEAVSDYTAALQSSPNLLWGYYGRGQAHLALGNAQPAIADFNAALRVKPDSINVLVLRGRANNLAKSYDAAIADLTDALVHPKVAALLPKERAGIFAQRAFALAKADRAAEAHTDIVEALRLAPQIPFAIAVSGLVDEKQGRMSEARDAYNRALAIEPNIALAKAGLERIAGAPQKEASEASEPPAKPEPLTRAAEPAGGGDTCAKYVPEIGRTVKVKCAD